MAQASGQEQLTVEECNHIWDTIIDPPTRNRRYSYGNMEVNCFINKYINLM